MTVLWFLPVCVVLISDQYTSFSLSSDVFTAENWHGEISLCRGSHAHGRPWKNSTCNRFHTPSMFTHTIVLLALSDVPSHQPSHEYVFPAWLHIHVGSKRERSHQPASSPSSIIMISAWNSLPFPSSPSLTPRLSLSFSNLLLFFLILLISTNLPWWIGSLTDAVGDNVMGALGYVLGVMYRGERKTGWPGNMIYY